MLLQWSVPVVSGGFRQRQTSARGARYQGASLDFDSPLHGTHRTSQSCQSQCMTPTHRRAPENKTGFHIEQAESFGTVVLGFALFLR